MIDVIDLTKPAVFMSGDSLTFAEKTHVLYGVKQKPWGENNDTSLLALLSTAGRYCSTLWRAYASILDTQYEWRAFS